MHTAHNMPVCPLAVADPADCRAEPIGQGVASQCTLTWLIGFASRLLLLRACVVYKGLATLLNTENNGVWLQCQIHADTATWADVLVRENSMSHVLNAMHLLRTQYIVRV